MSYPSREPDLVGPQADPADEFLRLACLTYGADDVVRRVNARAMLVAQPGLGADSIHVAAARADAATLRRLLAADPALANVEGGPFSWPPLLYLAYARHDPDVTADAVRDAVAVLTGAGADPGAGYLWHGSSPPFTALTGAFGEGEGGPDNQPSHSQWEALARALLEAGADPNDEQTLYNRMFRPDDSHLGLLFEFGLDAEEALLDQLAWAVEHGFDERVQLLHRHGVELGAVLHGAGAGGRTAWQLARWTGRNRTAQVIEGLGWRDELEPEDAVVAAVLAADEIELERLADAHPGVLERAPGWSTRPGALGGHDRCALAPYAWRSGRAGTSPPGPGSMLRWTRSGRRRCTMRPATATWPWSALLLELGADPTFATRRFDATPASLGGVLRQTGSGRAAA